MLFKYILHVYDIFCINIIHYEYIFLQVHSLDPEDPLEEGMATHSSILA